MVFKSGYDPFPDRIQPQLPDFRIKNPTGDISIPSAVSSVTRNPLCDKNILKGIDGVASLPESAEALGSSLTGIVEDNPLVDEDGKFKIAPPSFEDMFTGLPDITSLSDPEFILQSLGLPTEIDPEQVAKAAVDDVLRQLNIENPLAELCKQADALAQEAQQGILENTPTLPNINSLIPPVELPKFSKVTDNIPEVGDLF